MLTLPRNELRISITSACNMKCTYCHNEGNLQINFLTKNEIENLVIAADKFNLKSVRITGGEPLIHPEIEEICKTLSEKYNLKVSINTNGIEIEKLLNLIDLGYVKRVVIGLDYFDAPISKDSCIGVPSQKILENILEIKKRSCNVSVSTVYNNNYVNLRKIFNWCFNNKIRLKILETVNTEKSDTPTSEYISMRDRLIEEFELGTFIDPKYNEVNATYNDFVVASFFHSHCRIDECNVCKNLHLRVTANGFLKQCLFSSKNDICIKNGNLEECIKKAILQDINVYKED